MSAWCAAFALMFFLDIWWALYTQAMVASRPLLASTWATAIQLFNGALVLKYTDDPYLLIPACAGAFAGTWVVTSGRLRSGLEWCRDRYRPGSDI